MFRFQHLFLRGFFSNLNQIHIMSKKYVVTNNNLKHNNWNHTVSFFKGKEVNENATVPRDDMIFTYGQLNAARDGILIFNKWDNEKGEGSAMAVLPYQFDNKMNKDEQLIVKSVIQRFNNDMKNCLEIK